MKNLKLLRPTILVFALLLLGGSLSAQSANPAAKMMQPYFQQNGQYQLLTSYGKASLHRESFYQLYIKGRRSSIKRSECRLVFGQEEQEWLLEFEKQEGHTYRLRLPDNLPSGEYRLQVATRNSALNQYFNLVPPVEQEEFRFSIQ